MSQPLPSKPVTALTGVGAGLAAKLAKLGLHTVQDVLFHLPLRYQDRTRVTPIGALQPYGDAMVQGTVLTADTVLGRRRSLLCTLQDDTGTLGLRFYHGTAAHAKRLRPGTTLCCFGEPRPGATGLEIYHPEYRLNQPDTPLTPEATLTPIYPTTDGLSQPRLRKLCEQALNALAQADALPEWLPASLCARYQLMPLPAAIKQLHRPPPSDALALLTIARHPAQRRLAFEELLAHHLSLQKRRLNAQALGGFAMPPTHRLTQPLRAQLPFTLTAAQEQVLTEISTDMARAAPMLRLVQGDVGSGKTVVAALAALQAVENSRQVAIMAPTEILAEQHARHWQHWLQPLGIALVFLSSKITGKKRQAALASLAAGEAMVAVGTHALLQADVSFHRLGLIIIDEQHRFGVHQRLALRQKGEKAGGHPDQLIMTATPIPRTLAMSAYADLDCSVIDQLPPGRTPVNTVVMSDQRREQVITRLNQACLAGRQAYWVCPLIDASETLQCQAAEVTAAQLQAALPALAIGLLHGRLSSAEKAAVMAAFQTGQLHLLVATTVIEVGVDVPKASLMVIENPERLGLAQLHQLRGRVGRGNIASHCLLMYHPPLSAPSKARLAVLRQSTDGFVIAEKDLALRGPGDVLGTRQTGLTQFKVADLARDSALLTEVRAAAQQLLAEAPDSIEPLIARWLAHGNQYANV